MAREQSLEVLSREERASRRIRLRGCSIHVPRHPPRVHCHRPCPRIGRASELYASLAYDGCLRRKEGHQPLKDACAACRLSCVVSHVSCDVCRVPCVIPAPKASSRRYPSACASLLPARSGPRPTPLRPHSLSALPTGVRLCSRNVCMARRRGALAPSIPILRRNLLPQIGLVSQAAAAFLRLLPPRQS